MRKSNMHKKMWAVLFLMTTISFVASSVYVSSSDIMKCSYGERGSLTATCVNATAGYFKTTAYRFDQLDETLKCVNCSLKTIDSGTFDISGNQIKNLDLTKCQIELIKQKAFVGLIFLENLELSNNNIRSIYPGTFTGVKKIKYIDLSNNQINILSDDGFLELLNLEKLNLECNRIHTIAPRAFNGLIKLRELYLNNNDLKNIRDAFNNGMAIQILNLANNGIIVLTGNEFSNLTALLELNLAHNILENPVIEFQPHSVLRSLLLQNNNIAKIAPSFLKGLDNLENLDLSYNKISKINQRTLQNLYSLRNLNVSYNALTEFQTGMFSALPQLELLNCSHNKIQSVEITGVFSLHSVHALDLSYNQLKDLDYAGLISRLPRLSYLKLESNTLHCDLENEMDEYFKDDNFKYILYENSLGSKKCDNTTVRRAHQTRNDFLLTGRESTEKGTSGAEITIFILVFIIILCIGFLFYLQYRTYQQLKYSSPQRTTSSVHLISTDLEARENDDYLKE